MRQLTIRNVSEPLGRKLDELSLRSGKSINSLVLELLSSALGVSGRRARLARYVTWSQEDGREFDGQLRAQRQVDKALWR
jgi:hypothetical protein